MSTYDDRLAALERKVTHLELQRLHDQSLAEKNTPRELGSNLEEINKDMTILLGLYTRQSQDIQVIDQNLNEVKERVGRVENRLDSIDRRFEDVDKRFDGVDQRLASIEGVLAQILARLPEKSSQ